MLPVVEALLMTGVAKPSAMGLAMGREGGGVCFPLASRPIFTRSAGEMSHEAKQQASGPGH